MRDNHEMRYVAAVVIMWWACAADAGWRDEVHALVSAGRVADAVELAEQARAVWLAPHVARRLPPPEVYVGWVAAPGGLVAYGRRPAPWAKVIAPVDAVSAAVADLRDAVEDGRAPPRWAVDYLQQALFAPLAPVLASPTAPWVFATDGALSELPFALITDRTVIHALSERAAALAAFRATSARNRPATLFAFARSDAADRRALPAARAEIELAATALGGSAALLSGPDAFARLQVAAYDGTLAQARFVLIAAHTVHRDGVIALELGDDDGTRFTPADTLHLQFTAELVVLSACETASGSGFAEAGARSGVGMMLLTHWRIDDAASAQFVAALFAAMSGGLRVDDALRQVQQAFARGEHGDAYRHPYYWAGWQLWGGL